jgi:protein-L-isoaspartate(D-aspartate) O-methyltransferase
VAAIWFRKKIVSATITKPNAIRKKTSDAMSTGPNARSRILVKMGRGVSMLETKGNGWCVIIGTMKRIAQYLVVALVVTSGCQKQPASTSEFAAERQEMVEQQLKPRGIRDERVLAATAKVPREEFVPENLRAQAYADHALPIGHDQTISQPFIVAFMTEQLHPQPTDRILEIGTGSGYQTAILAELVKDVYTIEIVEPLAKDASARLARLGYNNAHVKVGDGYRGWPEVAPFDAIVVTCAPDKVPQPLTEQLKENGRMLVPVGTGMDQQLYLLEKKNGQLAQTAILPVRFVQMTGEAATKK